jgi:RHS repeat-associated protein
LTDSTGAVVSTIELDPWGGETARSSNQAKQPHRYTSYERDANGGDEAMLRRYESRWSRFSQPDPFDGSYNLTDPQSFNRYSYVQSDPVNFVDPSGLLWRFSQVCSNIDGVIHCDRPELYWEGNPPPGSTGNLDGPPRGGGGGLFDGDPPPAPETPSVPCPPTGNQLATDPNVHQAAFQALLDSRSGSTKAREQGGWLYALNGKIIARRARPGHSSGISIDLTNPPQIRGALLVGTFHTHPSILLDGGYMLAGLPQPSLRDELNAFDRGVPGLTVAVVDGKLKLTPYGPNRRGSNPERAIDPKGQYGGLIRGYPGNAANTTRCS